MFPSITYFQFENTLFNFYKPIYTFCEVTGLEQVSLKVPCSTNHPVQFLLWDTAVIESGGTSLTTNSPLSTCTRLEQSSYTQDEKGPERRRRVRGWTKEEMELSFSLQNRIVSDKAVSTKADHVHYGSCLCVCSSEVEMLSLGIGMVIMEGEWLEMQIWKMENLMLQATWFSGCSL